MIVQDPVFGQIEWKYVPELWEGIAHLPGIQKPIPLDVRVLQRRAPPAQYQQQGFVKFRDAWQPEVEPEVMQKIWDYWRDGVDNAGQFGSIPVDKAKASQLRSPVELYRTLDPLTISIPASADQVFRAEMRWDWDWDLMGVVAKFVGNRVEKVTSFGDDS